MKIKSFRLHVQVMEKNRHIKMIQESADKINYQLNVEPNQCNKSIFGSILDYTLQKISAKSNK